MVGIVFLGCGGGRHQTLDQSFRTGGFRIHGELNLHVDPGPGALLLTSELGLDPLDLNGVAVSHAHPDHYADAEVLVEAMSRGSSDGGRFVGSRSAVEGTEKLGPAISQYHKRKAGEVISLEPEESFEGKGPKLEAIPTKHSDPTGFGLKIHTDQGVIGYTGDTQYFEELPEYFTDSRVLIANVTRPGEKRIKKHLCIEDLVEILEVVDPEVSVILHMGMLFLKNSPKEEADYVENQTGVRTVPGFVGTEIELDGKAEVTPKFEQIEINKFS